jgi:hypothetical protein
MIYKINYHSFIDVITNSSTELYVSSTEKTIQMFKDLVRQYLQEKLNREFVDVTDYIDFYLDSGGYEEARIEKIIENLSKNDEVYAEASLATQKSKAEEVYKTIEKKFDKPAWWYTVEADDECDVPSITAVVNEQETVDLKYFADFFNKIESTFITVERMC